MSALHVFGIVFLIGMNAFFAAAEFSLVAVRLSRVRQLVEKGDPRAKIVEQLVSDLSRVVSGVQVGITIASLSLGYLGEITLATIVRPFVEQVARPWAAIVAHGVALVVVFGLLTVLQVIFRRARSQESQPRACRACCAADRSAFSLVPEHLSAGPSICSTGSPKGSFARSASSLRTATRSCVPLRNCR